LAVRQTLCHSDNTTSSWLQTVTHILALLMSMSARPAMHAVKYFMQRTWTQALIGIGQMDDICLLWETSV